MQQDRLSWLLQQHLANMATTQEQQELIEWLRTGGEQELFAATLSGQMERQTAIMPAQPEIWQRMVQNILAIDKPAGKPVFHITRWVAAAAVVLFISIAMYFFIQQRPSTPAQKTIPVLAITPVNKNVLTLADGSQVFPDEKQNGTLGKQQHTTITKRNDQLIYTANQTGGDTWYNVLSTARSGMYQLVLPDGSLVWLNSASSIRFPTSFTGKERVVELSGEAWFDVQHAETIPFLVRTGTITTAVLGTAFNVKAYPQQSSMTVAVQRGKVQIQSGNKTIVTLQKGRQARVMADLHVQQESIDTSLVAGWRQGNLLFKDETVEDILAGLQLIYTDSVSLHRSSLAKEKITVSFHKNAGVRTALEIICRITEARLLQKNGVYIIE
jgi:transmembrane sensor